MSESPVMCCWKEIPLTVLAISGFSLKFVLLGNVDRKIYASARIGDADFGNQPHTFGMSLAMDRLYLVFTSRHVLDGEGTILLGNREVGMLNQSNISKHPRMHVAFETQKYFGLVP